MNNVVELPFGTKNHFYITNKTGTTYDMIVYSKHYEKIISYNLTYDTSTKITTFNNNSIIEIGSYEEYFEGANNDYFVVKNGVLEYHKKLAQDQNK